MPAQVIAQIEAGIPAATIADGLGLKVADVLAMAAAYEAQRVIDGIVRNAQDRSKGDDPCQRALDAVRQVKKGIQNSLDTIKKHEGWIHNPSSYPGGLRPPFEKNPQFAVSTWEKQLANQRSSLSRMEKALETLEKAAREACRCWYKPWTWF